MSMFRSAADISSSDSESSSNDCEYVDETGQRGNNTEQPHRADDEETSGSRNSALGTDNIKSDHTWPSKTPGAEEALELDPDGHATLVTAALLEFFCMTRAVEILNAQPGSRNRFTRESAETKFLGQRLYAYKSQFLSMRGVMADGVDGENWQTTRQYYRDSLDMLGTTVLDEINSERPPALTRPRPKGVLEGRDSSKTPTQNTQLVPISRHTRRILPSPFSLPPEFERGTSFPSLLGNNRTISNILHSTSPIIAELPSLSPMVNLTGPVSMDHSSRYATEFSEIKLLGRGSFGQVYQVINHVDGQSYAVKKVPLSRRRLEILKQGGLQHLEHFMKEIKTLARLDHSHVVRYYGAWVEQPRSNVQRILPQGPRNQQSIGVLSQGPPNDSPIGENNTDSYHNSKSFDVVFGYSEGVSVGENSLSEAGHNASFAKMSRIQRQGSQTTNESTRSNISNTSIGEEDEDVESIPRRLSVSPPGLTSTWGDTDDGIFTDGFSENPGHLQIQHRCGNDNESPAIVLHIQMSLHPLTLSSYLRCYNRNRLLSSPSIVHRHCFHLIPSLRLVLGILSGVEYLHSKGIVHRDLKPANIFLSAPDSDPLTCNKCTDESNIKQKYFHPRIGDFGLVADISHCSDSTKDPPKEHISSYQTRQVGTEFYYPRGDTLNRRGNGKQSEYKEGRHDTQYKNRHTVDEKLDVYALGVILFEIIYKLNTKMERQLVLFDLTRSVSPDGFSLPYDFKDKVDDADLRLGDGCTAGERLSACIRGMLEPCSSERWSCQDVRQCLEKILSSGHDHVKI